MKLHLSKYLLLSLCIGGFSTNQIKAQSNDFGNIPYQNPLNIPIQLAANFGEIRTNHYHMGLDIRTQQRENLPVVSVADGYISRVYISPYGYGNMLMVTHPNGYTTLYGHLNSYMPDLAAYVTGKQYKDKSWQQDFTLPPSAFPVKKGQQIALSGNTGGSQGPHVHFEVRDTKTGMHYNPMLKGFTVPDNIPPNIQAFYWYDKRYSAYQSGPNTIGILGGNGQYKAKTVLKVGTPLIGFGLRAEDKTSNSPFYFGIYKAQLIADGKQIFQFTLNDFDNEQSRYVNAGIDYKRKMSGGGNIQYLYKLPGNQLNIFGGTVNNGILSLSDTNVHHIIVNVFDAEGHETNLNLEVQFDPEMHTDENIVTSDKMIEPNRPGRFSTPHADFIYSEKAFYDILPFQMKEAASTNTAQLSSTIQVESGLIPIHDFYTIGVAFNNGVPDNFKQNSLLKLLSKNAVYYAKGQISGNRLIGKFNRLGNVSIVLDTIAPKIIPINFKNQTVISSNSQLRFRVTDNYGELDSVEGFVDGDWLLFVQRSNTFTYKVDDHFPMGEHLLKIRVKDLAGNVKEETYSIIRK
ncbi:M23 family metallopeptidase [Rhizosphaericola mali]|uniref:M23 family metallopeptidase n=1 Tax=Rhizosphaericola mali TaxID=2545455 RepID=A0A5P2G1N2_9BACT|nr:M23 family metallopeptidase [Rhizosphaericola mali]QES87999.1 M23 family metallopeptidase [Rhizosphaericola mali]